MIPLTVGSLFAGIGALELGLERVGMRVCWQVELDPYARAVLAKHWPDAARHEDVRTVGAHNLEAVDVICGGFPCQDISVAGRGVGIDGARSGLWSEFSRIVRELRPRFVLVENVPALLTRGIGRVLSDLAGIGYDAEWSCVSACAVGAPHMRRRLFVVAYPSSGNGQAGVRPSHPRSAGSLCTDDSFARARADWKARMEDPSALYGGADGVADRMDRVRVLGNAVVPQVAEVLGRVILARAGA